MADITLYDANPVAMTALVTGGGITGYSIAVQYDGSSFATMDDYFREIPGSVTVQVTSSTVPTGYELGATGDGSWTSLSASSLVGTFVPATGGDQSFSFTIVLYLEGIEVARHDPTFTVRRVLAR